MSIVVRQVRQLLKAVPTLEGAGVHLKRAFGFDQAPAFDPFLLLDDFHGDDPEKYLRGFPWHPHRGIETITYVLRGEVEHGDSLGNAGTIGPGDVQWMTAGSGIIHQEMPHGDSQDRMWGFQLWANLPASHKMMAPRYREISSGEIPEAVLDSGARIKVICGEAGGVRGPVRDVVIEPLLLDIVLPPDTQFVYDIPEGHTAFAYTVSGEAAFEPGGKIIGKETVAHYGDGGRVEITSRGEGARFLLVAGKPLGEPIAWGGPIVMNSREELKVAFDEISAGTFIKTKG
jgi:redox-sensitive bicupin YhaK (pirin superfamily)